MADHSYEQLSQIWNKGRVILNYDRNVWRRDAYGNLMRREEHGKETEYGWEVDHIIPLSRGGSHTMGNLQPLQWQANRRKGDG